MFPVPVVVVTGVLKGGVVAAVEAGVDAAAVEAGEVVAVAVELLDRQFRLPPVPAMLGWLTVETVVAWHTVPVESQVPADPSLCVQGVPGVPDVGVALPFFFFST
jgi:hypothetical protein